MSKKDIIIKPLVTEKAIASAQKGIYGFIVHVHANKNQIKTEIEELFDVTVSSVRTNIRVGKITRKGKRMIPKKKQDYKIAYVTVTKGKIDLFPQT